MLGFLITLLIVALIFWLIYWIISIIPIPAPFKTILLVIFGVIAILYLIGLLVGFSGIHVIKI